MGKNIIALSLTDVLKALKNVFLALSPSLQHCVQLIFKPLF